MKIVWYSVLSNHIQQKIGCILVYACVCAKHRMNGWPIEWYNKIHSEYNRRRRCEVNQFNIINWQVLRYGKVVRGNITTKLKINNFETRHHLHRIFSFINRLVRAMVFACRTTTYTTNRWNKKKKKSQVVETNECIKNIHCFLFLSLSLSLAPSTLFAHRIQRLSKRTIKFAVKSISKLQIVSNVRQQRRLWLYFSIAQIQTNKQNERERKNKEDEITAKNERLLVKSTAKDDDYTCFILKIYTIYTLQAMPFFVTAAVAAVAVHSFGFDSPRCEKSGCQNIAIA